MPSSRLQSWFRDPFDTGRSWPGLFDWDSAWDSFLPKNGLAADLFEDDHAYHVRMELPGVKKKDVRVELENAVLTVSCQHSSGQSDDAERREAYHRSVSLPDGIVAEDVSAKMEDGILQITMPKAESTKPRKIDIS